MRIAEYNKASKPLAGFLLPKKVEVRNAVLVTVLLITSVSGRADEGAAEQVEEPISPQCAEFAGDVNADLGDVLRAGCEPTLVQMKKLMDNPVGNVAMFINQFDYYEMENPTTGKTAVQDVYTGILQFPKSISDNWNLINRVVFTVPSLPLDQDKIDQASGSTPPGAIIPPDAGGMAPVDLFEGRTTGFGDMYYVGFFLPSEG